jgi:hypothetical protein
MPTRVAAPVIDRLSGGLQSRLQLRITVDPNTFGEAERFALRRKDDVGNL